MTRRNTPRRRPTPKGETPDHDPEEDTRNVAVAVSIANVNRAAVYAVCQRRGLPMAVTDPRGQPRIVHTADDLTPRSKRTRCPR